jgi:predicted ATP-dependent serine protease
MNQRLREVLRLGFKECIIPQGYAHKLDIPVGLKIYAVRNIREAIEIALN